MWIFGSYYQNPYAGQYYYSDVGNGGGATTPTGPDGIDLEGRQCPVEQAAAENALDALYVGSPTAKALIDTAAGYGVDINLVKQNLSGFGAQPQFEASSMTITWDPFAAQRGTNSDGSIWEMSPIMILAHELVHAGHAYDPVYQGAGSEMLVMQVANQIAAEMNANTGSSYQTTRDTHVRDSIYNVTSSSSTLYSIARPGCA